MAAVGRLVAKRALALVKTESTYGVDPSPAGADAIVVRNVKWGDVIDVKTNKKVNTFLGDLPLSIGEPTVCRDCRQDRRGRRRRRAGLLEQAGPDEQRLRRHLQAPSDLLEDLGAGLLQPPLDLGQIGVGDPGELRQLTQREPGSPALFAQVTAEVELQRRGHASIMLALVSICKLETA